MPCDHAYYRWYRPITQKYVDCNNTKLDIMIEIHLALLKLLPVGSPGPKHVLDVLEAVDELHHVAAANGQANNGHETESAATATPSTSIAPLITPSCGQRATASPSTSATKGHGRHAIASPSTSAARGRGQRAITPQHDDEPEDDTSQPPPPPKHYTRLKKRKIGD